MTSEKEQKRKELEDDKTDRRLKEFRKVQKSGTTTEYDRGYLDAQKEFLDYLQWLISDKSNYRNKKYYPTVVLKIKELKQSIGEKT